MLDLLDLLGCFRITLRVKIIKVLRDEADFQRLTNPKKNQLF